MRFFALFVAVLFFAQVAVAQEVATTTTPSLTEVLDRSGFSARSTLQSIYNQLLNEVQYQEQGAQQIQTPSTYNAIFNQVFDGASTATTTAGAFLGVSDDPAQGADSAKGAACTLFATSFKAGDEAPEVLRIQQFLNGHSAETVIATEGAGAPGNETTYYGDRTFLAVWAFQQKYKADILTPLGLLHPTGFWGASTRAKANELLGCE